MMFYHLLFRISLCLYHILPSINAKNRLNNVRGDGHRESLPTSGSPDNSYVWTKRWSSITRFPISFLCDWLLVCLFGFVEFWVLQARTHYRNFIYRSLPSPWHLNVSVIVPSNPLTRTNLSASSFRHINTLFWYQMTTISVASRTEIILPWYNTP